MQKCLDRECTDFDTNLHVHCPPFEHSFTFAGELMTAARWIRHFLTAHPLYKQDSVVTEEMTYDLVRRMREISEGAVPCPELMGKLLSKSVDN